MPFSNYFHIAIKDHPPGKPPPKLFFNAKELQQAGLNMLVTISNSKLITDKKDIPANPISVFAHFDTGASVTSIDEELAAYIGLISIGKGQTYTANGLRETNKYSIDIVFQNTSLNSLHNLPVQSCDLPFDLKSYQQNESKPSKKEFGVLIGRDIMSRWQITWHGPTSTVFISD